jgi:hypothetical protein
MPAFPFAGAAAAPRCCSARFAYALARIHRWVFGRRVIGDAVGGGGLGVAGAAGLAGCSTLRSAVVPVSGGWTMVRPATEGRARR